MCIAAAVIAQLAATVDDEDAAAAAAAAEADGDEGAGARVRCRRSGGCAAGRPLLKKSTTWNGSAGGEGSG